jgi:DNA-binding MarR family transcriptional regulator
MFENQQARTKVGWTLLSNHGHVLICLVREPEMRLRDVAMQVGITERAVQKIVSDLEEAGFVRKEKIGRCNRYQINGKAPLRHPLEKNRNIGELLHLLC